MRISLANSDRSFSAVTGRPILDAALQAGLRLPYSCKGGSCGLCRARLLAGRITYPAGRPLGLSADEAAAGYILLCRAHASEDIRLETIELATPEQATVKRLPARIERLERLAHDVMGVHLRLPAAESFAFLPGQYIDVLLARGRRRSFSIASAPGPHAPLELHVRRVAGGEFSEHLFEAARRGDLLSIVGPLGRCVYAPGAAPLLMLAGGTGIAPLLSMLRHVAASSTERSIDLYWGVREVRDLYAHATLLDLSRDVRGLRYTPVLSKPAAEWAGARGWVHAVALDSIADLSAVEIYAAGPPAMIDALRAALERRQVPAARLVCDVFEYAAD